MSDHTSADHDNTAQTNGHTADTQQDDTQVIDTVLLDVDGTLIDSSYQLALAWWHAFEAEGLHMEIWRIHRCIGMGGDHIVAHLFDDTTEKKLGESLRDRWEKEFEKVVDEIRAIDGAADLVRSLRGQGLKVALASSSPEKFTKKALKALGLTEDDFDAVTTSSDTENAKPDPDILQVALERTGGRRAVVVGDSTWDIAAAQKIGANTATVKTGGFGADELTSAGAAVMVDTVADLVDADWQQIGAKRN